MAGPRQLSTSSSEVVSFLITITVALGVLQSSGFDKGFAVAGIVGYSPMGLQKSWT